jgi:sigma-E factor negative regulatory protein RseA
MGGDGRGDAMNDDKTMQTREIISALADGQLRGDEFVRGVALAAGDPEGTEAWHLYHLVGDALRSGELASAAPRTQLLDRVRAGIAQEPQFAIETIAADAVPVRAAAVFASETQAANDGSFRWKLVAGFASLAAVAAVGWMVVGAGGGTATQPQLAQGSAPAGTVQVSTSAGPMLRDPQLDELLAAHRQLGGAPALQQPAGFLRNATFEGPAR